MIISVFFCLRERCLNHSFIYFWTIRGVLSLPYTEKIYSFTLHIYAQPGHMYKNMDTIQIANARIWLELYNFACSCVLGLLPKVVCWWSSQHICSKLIYSFLFLNALKGFLNNFCCICLRVVVVHKIYLNLHKRPAINKSHFC